MALLGMVAVLALGAAPAQAQGQPAICEDYPDLEICEDDEGNEGEDGEDDGAGAAGPSAGTGGGDGDGSLPFTGYPLTGLILLLLLLLAAGLALRAAIAFRDRLDRGSLQR